MKQVGLNLIATDRNLITTELNHLVITRKLGFENFISSAN
jgi:hypothetical protein